MIWKKLGCVYEPNTEGEYQYAMFPQAVIQDAEKGLVRIYYTHRDQQHYGFPTYMDVSVKDEEFKILYNHDKPILEKNEPGAYDDSGINITSIIQIDGLLYFYYLAWNLSVTVPFRNSIGLAVANTEGTKLRRIFEGPLMDRSRDFPYLCATPCVIKDGLLYRMWHASGEPWIFNADGSSEVACFVGYAESSNGMDWNRTNIISVGHKPTDHVTTSPFVLYENGIYKMWYSYRGKKYRIGYAESTNSKEFIRKDESVGITVSDEGWDSEMVCYPHVFTLNQRRYMLYCGNEYGKTGFGLAIEES